MGETAKGQRARPVNRIILQTTFLSQIRTSLKTKITKRTHFSSWGRYANHPLTPKLFQTGSKNEPIYRATGAPISNRLSA
jgi:hypothetical protein